MKIVLSWLREFCDTTLTAEEVAELLTSKGAEVEGIDRPWERLEGVVVARVLEVRDHPDSDKLCLSRVSYGSGEREVVVGVRNMRPGDLVPLARPGASVPGLPEPLSARKIRGVISDGMLCSPRELGLGVVHEGILILPAQMREGDDLKAALGLDDSVIDIEVTPNRPDFLSVMGVAREVAAATGVPFEVPWASEGNVAAADIAVTKITVEDPERCPRYLARIIRGVRSKESPLRVQARLTAAGMRPISAAVDATNYAMLEIGQPLHPFDLDLLDGGAIVVRRASEGERMTTLDGVERAFTTDDLLIADESRAIAVAGVMGGRVAEVSDATSTILLESASFERGGVQRTRRRIGLSTEASMRFERGVDPEAVPLAADRAGRLMAEWCGAELIPGVAEVGSAPARRRVVVRPERAMHVIGYEVTAASAGEAFARLGMSHTASGEGIEVEIPGYRVDLENEIDLVEEILRVEGYGKVGSELPPVRQTGGMPPVYAFVRRVRAALVRSGLLEVRLPAFVSEEDLARFGDDLAIRVTNPLAAEEGFLRTRLAPGLLSAVERNLSRQVKTVPLFEIGTVFRRGAPVDEYTEIAAVLTGTASRSWAEPERSFDFFDIRGVVETLMASLGIWDWSLETPAAFPYHPGRSAEVLVSGRRVGTVGELSPQAAPDGAGRVAMMEMSLAALMRSASSDVAVEDVPRFPPVRRDLSFTVDAAVAAGAVLGALLEAGAETVGSAVPFDVFAGPPLPAGKKSLAFAVDFRADDRTLTDAEADGAVKRMVDLVRTRFGAELRSAG